MSIVIDLNLLIKFMRKVTVLIKVHGAATVRHDKKFVSSHTKKNYVELFIISNHLVMIAIDNTDPIILN